MIDFFSPTKLHHKISRRNEILEPQRVFIFLLCRAPLKVSTKSGTNFGHFARTVVNEMNPRDIFVAKGHNFQSQSYPPPILNENVLAISQY